MSLDCEVVLTRSGAPAMRDRTTGELMHPVVGPLVEAEKLYAAPSRLAERLRDAHETMRLRDADETPLVLLDVGLGAGSNAVAAWRISEAIHGACRRLEIVSFDQSLAALTLALAPEHASAFGLEGGAGVAARRLLVDHRHESARTVWRLREGDLLSTLALEKTASADVVFWDPFSRRANPSLWTVTTFAAVRRVCRDGATLHTYSAATSTRSALLLAGFAVGVGGDPDEGKHTTSATVNAADLGRPLGRRWLDRLRRSSAPFPPDAPADALERIAALPQFSTR
jgi:queuine tRNA-ribosyltransferase